MRKNKIKNSLWIAACFLLIGCNIAFFLLFPRLMSGLAIVLSNVVTLVLTFLAFRPLNNWLQNNLLERQQERRLTIHIGTAAFLVLEM